MKQRLSPPREGSVVFAFVVSSPIMRRIFDVLVPQDAGTSNCAEAYIGLLSASTCSNGLIFDGGATPAMERFC